MSDWQRHRFPMIFSLVVYVTVSPVHAATDAGGVSTPDVIPVYPRDFEEDVKPFTPAIPDPPQASRRVDASAWYMTGRLRERANDKRGALAAYRQAIELNPDADAVYEALVALALELNQLDDAKKYAAEAIKRNPGNHRLLQLLGLRLAAQGNAAEAVKLLEQAAQSPSLDKTSSAFVLLKRHLAVIYSLGGDVEHAADCYTVVFEALTQPEKYKLDDETRQRLLADRHTSFEQIGQVFLAAERVKLAQAAFEKAASLGNAKPGSLSYNLARVYVKTGQPAKAIQQLQVYFDAQLQSKGKNAYQLLAEILTLMKKQDELIPRLEQLAQRDPKNTYLQFYLAEQYLAAKRLSDAEAVYQRVQGMSENASALLGLAHVYRLQNRPGDFQDCLTDALLKAPNNRVFVAQFESEINAGGATKPLMEQLINSGKKRLEADPPKLKFEQAFVLTKLAVVAEQTDAAASFCSFALKTQKAWLAKNANIMELYLRTVDTLIRTLLAKDQSKAAADLCRLGAVEPLFREPGRMQFLFLLSQAAMQAGDTDAALAAINDARKIGDHYLLHFQEARIRYQSRQWDQAIKLFADFVKKFPDQKDLALQCQFSISNIYVMQGQMQKGEEVLEKVYAAEPDNTTVNNDLGYLYADQGKFLPKAESMIRKALNAEPENPAFLDSMGWVLYKRGRPAEALPYLLKAAELLDAEDPTILDHLADNYLKLNQSAKSKELWQRALKAAQKEKMPDKDLIKRIQKKLKNASPTDEPIEAKRTPASGT